MTLYVKGSFFPALAARERVKIIFKMFLQKQMIWFKDLENNKILSLQFYKILSTYNAKIILFSTHSCTLTTPINYSCSLDKSIYRVAVIFPEHFQSFTVALIYHIF
jgi:hypothetical protein